MSGYTIEEIREMFEKYLAENKIELSIDRDLQNTEPNNYKDIDTFTAFDFYRAGFNAVKVNKDE